MAKQEEITEWINKYLTERFIYHPTNEVPDDECLHEAKRILSHLQDNGVAIQVDRELPDNEFWHKVEREFEAYCAGKNDMLGAGFGAFEPLIKE